ncbi:hypothetical protein BDN67DRAFT_240368 [Paxillus ammoniavirescens]|nr:hypothetical protein BDN67DRAFT_240368 [Paxillus ammoniavirescens]
MTESNTDMDIQPTQADAWTSPNISDTNIAIDHEDKLGTVLQAEPSLCPMMQGGDVKADGTGGRNSELPSRDCGSAFSFTPDEELSHVQAMATPWGDRVDRTPICAHSSNDPSPVSCPMTTEEETFPVPSPIADVRCSGGIPADNHALVMLRGHVELAKYTPNLEALSLHASVASVVMEPGARETCSTDNSNHVQTSRTVLNNLEDNTRLAYYNHAHQEAIPEDLDCFGEDFPSSSAPPASSPPQLFHSSPFASSQSSISVDDEIQKKEKVTFEEEDRTHRDGSKAEDEMTIPLHSEDEHCRDPSGEIRTDMATSPDIDHSLVTLDLLGGTVDGPRSVDGHLGKRPLLEDHVRPGHPQVQVY